MAARIEPLESRLLLAGGPRQVENLDRGVVAVRASSTQAFVSWRLLALDSPGVGFNVYRSANGAAAVKLNGSPLTQGTNYTDATANFTLNNIYSVRPVIGGVEQSPSAAYTLAPTTAPTPYLTVPLQVPAGGTTPDNVAYTYSANDMSVGDLDGDGDYEYVVKWDPSNSKDNSQSGYTGNVYLDAYQTDGTRLWRIDLGINIRAGAHYTQFMVYDLDGDGRAEVACKTAPGTKDGLGTNVLLGNDNAAADYRNSSGYILSGSEYLTVFNGLTGANMATVGYYPPRGSVSSWGDSYGNRVDRFLAGVAYLDGQRPSLVMCRGYYTRAVLAAYDWRNGALTLRWVADSNNGGMSALAGQGAHSLNVADLDLDGKDEIVYGAAAVNDNGTLLYSTGLGHGDALHTGDMDPSRPGPETFMVHETQSAYGTYGGDLRSGTGQLLHAVPGTGDVGRGVAFDVEPNPGYEMWSTGDSNMYNVNGSVVAPRGNAFVNFGAWWDGDFYRELLDGTTISDWNFVSHGRTNLDLDPNSSSTFPPNVSSNNGTKSTPALSADILGDWREEVIWRRSDSTAFHIYTTTIPTSSRLVTLMHDVQYREAIAWQNVAYNQPPHPSFFLGNGMATPPTPNVYLAGGGTVTGRSFHDRNGDGFFSAAAGDVTLAGATVYVDSDANGLLDSGEPSALTDASGNYSILGVAPGTYGVREVAPAEYAVANTTLAVVTAGGTSSGNDFANARIVYHGTTSGDGFVLRKNAGGKFEILIGGSVAYTVFAAVPSLTFNLGEGDDALTLDLAQGTPVPSGGVNVDGGGGGGGEDRVTIVGTAAAEDVSFATGTIAISGTTVTYGGVEGLSFDGNGGWDNVSVSGGPALRLDDAQQLESLMLTGSARVALPVGGVATLVTRQLAIGSQARLDLADNDLIIDYADGSPAYGQTHDYVAAGANGGAWDGLGGIVTSMPDAPGGLTTLGVGDASAVLGLSGMATQLWSGQTVDATSVLVKYTYGGDANLDGQITGDDYSSIDFNVLVPGSVGFCNGDFNYDGLITGDDYSTIDFNLVAQDGPL